MTLAHASSELLNPPEYTHDWALVDVETSGLVARRDRVLSVAVVTVDSDGAQTGQFSTLVNPGCDPGPVHIHGLSPERLRAAPTFEQVTEHIATLLRDRVMVAHNAQFDYDFLAHEFARARTSLPVSRRLCTLALNRQVDPPTADLRLGTLAAHYGVEQTKAHEALDDTRVLAGILWASLQQAARLGLPLPLVSCPPRQDSRFMPQPPKTPCEFRNPGRLSERSPLTQGMKIAITGETTSPRAELVAKSVAVGLNVMSSVSRHTSVLVTNDQTSGSAKARRAREDGVPVVDERTFLRLLADVRPGTPHSHRPVNDATAQPPDEPESGTDRVPVGAISEPKDVTHGLFPEAENTERPLTGRRVLILGGTHPTAAAARDRVTSMGGAAAVNLSASVTDVLLLDGGSSDRRMRRISSLEIPTYEADWLDAPFLTPTSRAPERRQAPRVLPRGGVIDLPYPVLPSVWSVTACWAPQTGCEVDLVAFILDDDDQVARDENFVFYGAPENPEGTVRLLTDGPAEQTITSNLLALPPAARKVVIAAAVDGTSTFGDVGAIQVTTGPDSSTAPVAQAALDAATTERTMLLAELYRRGPLWRFRAVGQGYDHGLDGLARACGVDIQG